jgi:hypothetical protein
VAVTPVGQNRTAVATERVPSAVLVAVEEAVQIQAAAVARAAIPQAPMRVAAAAGLVALAMEEVLRATPA